MARIRYGLAVISTTKPCGWSERFPPGTGPVRVRVVKWRLVNSYSAHRPIGESWVMSTF